MESITEYQSENLVIGGGIAGMVTALELLKQGQRVTILEGQAEGELGGLARQAFGGMMLVGTPEQQKMKIADSPEQALADWYNFAEFKPPFDPVVGDPHYWPKQWAHFYVNNSVSDVYQYVKALGCSFLPAVNWVERGDYIPGNSLPRYHVLWGTSADLVAKIKAALTPYLSERLTILYDHKVTDIIKEQGRVLGCLGTLGSAKAESAAADNADQRTPFRAQAKNTIVASGGFTGNLTRVREYWPTDWGKAPEFLLNGSHPSADGAMHLAVEKQGGKLTQMSEMWNYAAGIAHPKPAFPGHGLSLIPCRSALWLDHKGRRIGPKPLMTGFNTTELCRSLSQLEQPYSWLLLNKRIALKEFAVSGADHNPMIRDKRFLTFVKDTLLGNHRLFNQMKNESDDFLVADSVAELAAKMNALTGTETVNESQLRATIADFDAVVSRPQSQWNDDQLRRILDLRRWRVDRLRTCYPKPLLSEDQQTTKDNPLVAIRVAIISRKSLGGIQTNLNSQVLDDSEQAITGLYAVGEAAGFGGGGASGKRSLEGTFLSSCILTARQAARAIGRQASSAEKPLAEQRPLADKSLQQEEATERQKSIVTEES